MPNDLTPGHSSSPLEIFLEKLNLPEMIAGPAGKAISRLVAGVVDIPAAGLERITQSIKNKTAGKKLVADKLAAAAADLVVGDAEIVERAAFSLLAKECRRQKNKEEIAKKTIEILQDEAAAAPQGQTENAQASTDVDEDWLNVFEKYAEEASTERMQTLWARVLAGEIRTPKAFSLKTLRFLSELDQETATLFEKYIPFICNDSALLIALHREGQILSEMFHLEDAGLLTGVNGDLELKISFLNGQEFLTNQQREVLLSAGSDISLVIPCLRLTKIGIEISKIAKLPFDLECLTKIVELIPKNQIESVVLAGNPPTTLWTKPVQGQHN
jgi:hypothetical protein